MAQYEIKISQAQSRIFARAIYSDVIAYIETHQEEYQKFLAEESEDTLKNEN